MSSTVKRASQPVYHAMAEMLLLVELPVPVEGVLAPPAAEGEGDAEADCDGLREHMGAAQAELTSRRREVGNMCNMLYRETVRRMGERG